MQDRSYKSDLALREELDTLKAARENELKAANVQKATLEERIKLLASEKASLEEDLAAKEDTIRQTVSRSEEIHHECSLLKEQHGCCSNERENMDMDLREAQKNNEMLKKALARAEDQALFFERRMLDLNRTLSQTPDRVAAVNAMIETKDKMFSDLEARAGECYTNLVALKRRSRGDQERAETEIAALEKRNRQSEALITKLTESKAIFQQQSADVLAMLRTKVFETDFVRAMDHHFSLVVQDNNFLQSTVLGQTQELSAKDLESASLNSKILEINRSLEDKEERHRILESRLREKEDQVCALELETNALCRENEEANAQHDTIIANMEKSLRAAHAYLDETRDERERELIRSKDCEILHLKEDVKNHHELQEQVHAQQETINDYTAEVCMTHFRMSEISAELQAAEKKTAALEQHTLAQLGLPATLTMLEVLGQMEELNTARRKCHDLEEELQTAQVDAEKRRAAFNNVTTQSERWLYGLQDVGLEILARLRGAQEPQNISVEPPLSAETDAELEYKLRRFWDAF